MGVLREGRHDEVLREVRRGVLHGGRGLHAVRDGVLDLKYAKSKRKTVKPNATTYHRVLEVRAGHRDDEDREEVRDVVVVVVVPFSFSKLLFCTNLSAIIYIGGFVYKTDYFLINCVFGYLIG